VFVEALAGEDIFHVVGGAGEVDGGAELFGGERGGGFLGEPALDAGGSGIVFGEGEGAWVVAVLVALEGAGQIPGSDFEVGFGIEEIGRLKGLHAGSGDPICCGGLHYLHESTLTGGTAGGGLETGFLPDEGFEEAGVDGVFGGGGEDEIVVRAEGGAGAVLLPEIPRVAGEEEEGGQNPGEDRDEESPVDASGRAERKLGFERWHRLG